MLGGLVVVEIRSSIVLPARREDVTLCTSDGHTLVGELAVPPGAPPVATLVTVHPLPTAGGTMDSHVLRKAAARLPAQAGCAVLRFNTRGTASSRGRSEGAFDDGVSEGRDLAAALDLVRERGLPRPWLVGWSFGTEVILKHALGHPMAGAILLSPPLRRTTAEELLAWREVSVPLVAIVPEHDDFLPPAAARRAFAVLPHCVEIDIAGAKHLWVGETATRAVLTEIVRVVHPAALPLATEWDDGNEQGDSGHGA